MTASSRVMADRSRGNPQGIAPVEDERDATESPDAYERIMRGVNVGERTRSPGQHRGTPNYHPCIRRSALLGVSPAGRLRQAPIDPILTATVAITHVLLCALDRMSGSTGPPVGMPEYAANPCRGELRCVGDRSDGVAVGEGSLD